MDSSCQPDSHDPAADYNNSRLQEEAINSDASNELSKQSTLNKAATTQHLYNSNHHYSAFNVTENAAATLTDVETTDIIVCAVHSETLNNLLVANVYQSSEAHGNTPDDSNTMPLHYAAIDIPQSTQSLAEDDDYDEVTQYTTTRGDEIIKLQGDPAYFPLSNQCTTDSNEIIKLHEDPAYNSTIQTSIYQKPQ